MNQDLLSGVCEAAGLPPTAARLDPAPGRCCVTVDLAADPVAGAPAASNRPPG